MTSSNVHERTMKGYHRTNNIIGGWNNRFSSLVDGVHPNMWKFLESLKKEQSYVEAQLHQAEAGLKSSSMDTKPFADDDEQLLSLTTNIGTPIPSETKKTNDIVAQLKNSSTDTILFVDNNQQLLSSASNSSTQIPSGKKKKERKKKKNTNDKCVPEIQRSPFETKFNTVATPTEKKILRPLILSTHSSKFDSNKCSSNNDCPESDQLTNEIPHDDNSLNESYSYVNIKSQRSTSNIENTLEKSYSDVVKKQPNNVQLLGNDNLGESLNLMHQMKLFMNELKGDFNKRFDQLDTQIKNVDKRVNTKIDQLSQKIDNIYETNAAQLILNRLRADHNLDVPYMLTNRTFNESYSPHTKNLFVRFQKYLKHHYEHLWKKIREDVAVSVTPQQMEFDILGFSFEHSSQERKLIQSPNLEATSASSSYSSLPSFNANTVIFAEVTTSFLTFHHDDLSICEKKNNSSNQINIERKTASFRLFRKLLQLERGIAFILLYYKIELEQILVVLFGRFIDSKGHRSPEHIYEMLFESSFAKTIPLLQKLYLRDRNEKHKQLYFIC
ncbi:unnamed protein product [Rotaria sp. Silwood1]|nr:unnamed protein product [Rotaria sp. Silwood1]